MDSEKTRESQYLHQVQLRKQQGLSSLGLSVNQLWHDDPRHLCFLLARYKFVSKMLAGKQKVLEVGCGDAFGTRVVMQEIPEVYAVDFDPVFVKDVNDRMEDSWRFVCKQHDILEGPVTETFDAVYSIDVIEHIPKEMEGLYFQNIVGSMKNNGVLIVGTPSIQSQVYASELSKQGHVNCKDSKELKALMSEYFENVFIFSMNDEVVHTGYYPMAHYLWAIGAGIKDEK